LHKKITIIIPVYNTEKYLHRCLDSILAQTFTDFECILIDDSSKDNSIEICEDYAKKDNRVIALKNDKNMGASLTRQKGLSYAKGEYIQFIDSDDYIEKDMLEKMYDKASKENLDIVFCDMLMLQDCRNIYIKANIDNKDKIEMIKNIGVVINSYTASLCNKITKKQIFNNVKFSNSSFAEDKYISLQTAYYAEKVGSINCAFYNYVRNSYSSTENIKYNLERKKDHFSNYRLIVEFLTEKYGKDIELFEPELSDGVNSLKIEISSDKKARAVVNIHELYPNADKRIFSKTGNEKLDKKILFYMIIHKFPFAYAIFDTYLLARRILKKIKCYIISREYSFFIA